MARPRLDPQCVVCRERRVPKHDLPAPPFPPVCDECQRAAVSRPVMPKGGWKK